MTSFILETPGCARVDAWRLYRRVMVCALTGNTDAHLKNFAMYHTPDGLRLTPAYDLVAAALYREYQTFALAIGGAGNASIGQLKPKHFVRFAEAAQLSPDAVIEAVTALDRRRAAAGKAVRAAAVKADARALGDSLLDLMERRWNGTFSSIGRYLSTKQSDAAGG
jgi:serine/threonine-protein kinase HipA